MCRKPLSSCRPVRKVYAKVRAYTEDIIVMKVQIMNNTISMAFPSEATALALIIASGCHERLTSSIFERLLRPGYVVLDLGVSFGYYTLIATKLEGDKGRVYAFEPEPLRFVF